MYLTAHAAVGVLLSETTDDPVVVFFLGFVSHFALDAIPHGDEDVADWIRTKPKIGVIIGVIDLVCLTTLLAVLYATQPPETIARASAGVAGAVLPDFITNIVPFLHREMKWFRFLRHANRVQTRLGLTRLWRGHDWIHARGHNAARFRFAFWKGLAFQGVVVTIALILFFLHGHH